MSGFHWIFNYMLRINLNLFSFFWAFSLEILACNYACDFIFVEDSNKGNMRLGIGQEPTPVV